MAFAAASFSITITIGMNRVFQKGLIVMTIVALPICLMSPYFMSIVLLIIGFTQYFASLLDVMIYRKESQFKWHLIWSTIVLVMVYKVIETENSPDVLIIFTIIGCICLPIYYWVLLFDSDWDKKSINEIN